MITQRPHNPFRVRTSFDKLMVWLEIDRRPVRHYCTRIFRNDAGELFLERRGRNDTPMIRNARGMVAPLLLTVAL